MAEPTMPRWPATKTRRPSSAKSSSGMAARPAMAAFARYRVEVGPDHRGDELPERRPGPPAEHLARLGGVADQVVHVGRPEGPGIDFHPDRAGAGVPALLVNAVTVPGDVDARLLESKLDELRTVCDSPVART